MLKSQFHYAFKLSSAIPFRPSSYFNPSLHLRKTYLLPHGKKKLGFDEKFSQRLSYLTYTGYTQTHIHFLPVIQRAFKCFREKLLNLLFKSFKLILHSFLFQQKDPNIRNFVSHKLSIRRFRYSIWSRITLSFQATGNFLSYYNLVDLSNRREEKKRFFHFRKQSYPLLNRKKTELYDPEIRFLNTFPLYFKKNFPKIIFCNHYFHHIESINALILPQKVL